MPFKKWFPILQLYKGFFSVLLLAICDAYYAFTLIDIGECGSSNDRDIFLNSLVAFQCRSKGNITGGARERRRREPLGGSGGMLPQKILKARGLKMLFPAFSKSDM